MAFVVREGDGYKGIVNAPLVVNTEGEEAGALEQAVKVLERHIVKYPDQWYNFISL
jgi:hypothetical protein